MAVIDKIASGFYDLYYFFSDVASECWDAFYIPNIIGDWFKEVAKTCMYTSGRLYSFSDDIDALIDQVADILTWSNILSLIRSWLPDLEGVISWWQNWYYWVRDKIDEWWLVAQESVKSWIDIATEGLDNLKVTWDTFWEVAYPWILGKLDDLWVKTTDFFTITLPTLISSIDLETWWTSTLKDIEVLKDSWFEEHEPFWEGWQEWKDRVIEFFTDPLEWLLDRFTDWFLGPEE